MSTKHRSSAVAAVAVAAAALLFVAAACGGGASSQPSAGAASSGGGAACDTSKLPGWPAIGQVRTTGVIPVLASSEKVVGPNTRLLFSLVDGQGKPVADASLKVQIAFYDLCKDPTSATQVVDPLFAWGIVNQRAFYVARAKLTEPGPWGAKVTITAGYAGSQTAQIQFSVDAKGSAIPVGATVPSVKTPVLSDVGGDVHQISSDTNPDPDFYKLSEDQAVAQHIPFVLVFATPAFCQSAQCGPTLEVVKAAVKARPITTINVEPYQLQFANGRLQPVQKDGSFVPVAATDAFGLQTEPFIFVIDGQGKVVDEFEAVVAAKELDAAIQKALAGA